MHEEQGESKGLPVLVVQKKSDNIIGATFHLQTSKKWTWFSNKEKATSQLNSNDYNFALTNPNPLIFFFTNKAKSFYITIK